MSNLCPRCHCDREVIAESLHEGHENRVLAIAVVEGCRVCKRYFRPPDNLAFPNGYPCPHNIVVEDICQKCNHRVDQAARPVSTSVSSFLSGRGESTPLSPLLRGTEDMKKERSEAK